MLDFLDGYQFFRDCDQKFVYANGKCSEIAEQQVKKKKFMPKQMRLEDARCQSPLRFYLK